MTDDLVSWLSACLDALEAAAVAASGRSAEWHVEEGKVATYDSPDRDPSVIAGGKPIVVEDAEYSRWGVVEHIALHDPRAVLARVEAERAVIRRYETLCTERNRTYDDHAHYPPSEPWVGVSQHIMEFAVGQLQRTIADLAHGHRHDHPGFRDEWSPDAVPSSSGRF